MSKVTPVRFVLLLLVCGACAVGLLLVTTYGKGDKKFVMGNTSCMSPTINSGDIIYVRPFDIERSTLRRYQIVLFRPPQPVFADMTWVMRVVGLPGEYLEIKTNSLLVNQSEVANAELPPSLQHNKQWLTPQILLASTQRQWLLGPDEVFVIGDNLSAANDSRFWGPLNLSNVLGEVEKKATGKQKHLKLDPVLPIRVTVTTEDGRSDALNKVRSNQFAK